MLHLLLGCGQRAIGYHGVRRKHLQRYLDEFAYRWNRRRHVRASFDTLLGLSMRQSHASYRDLVGQTA
jgi:hypothetical protein